MEHIKSLDEVSIIAGVLRDISAKHDDWLKPREARNTEKVLRDRVTREGLSFLTIALPRLGKAFDKALSCTEPMVFEGFVAYRGNDNISHNFPSFLGELFRRVLDQHGTVLPSPCFVCVRYIRQLLYCFYKYDLPYADSLNQDVIARFVRTEQEVRSYNEKFKTYREKAFPEFKTRCGHTPYSPEPDSSCATDSTHPSAKEEQPRPVLDQVNDGSTAYLRPLTRQEGGLSATDALILSRAQLLLHRLFEDVNLRDIKPRHGPGTVSTKEVGPDKYMFRSVPKRLTDVYPWDSHFCASLGHASDCQRHGFYPVDNEEPYARVCLVPKDSRGPRLISCEPLAFQWIQQGIRRVLYEHVERHRLTRWNVFFTNQQPNQFGALLGSKTGAYATLDLKDASDRVGLELVRLLFPGTVLPFLEAARSIGTELPDGSKILLGKFAPMGSALCFPVMALTIWALLSAGAEDTDTRESILVYGDDVIVPTAYAAKAIETLEAFGLKANLDKCCIKGSFRESCGVDAFNGHNVTPLRIRKLIPSLKQSPKKLRSRPEVYLSWLAYASRLWNDGYYEAYTLVANHLLKVYGQIPCRDQVVNDFARGRGLSVSESNNAVDSAALLSLPWLPIPLKLPSRWNQRLQRREVLTWGVVCSPVKGWFPGWCKLLRFFTEWTPTPLLRSINDESFLIAEALRNWRQSDMPASSKWSSDTYTARRSIVLARRWRSC